MTNKILFDVTVESGGWGEVVQVEAYNAPIARELAAMKWLRENQKMPKGITRLTVKEAKKKDLTQAPKTI